jgi:hypothetical protein
MFQTLFEKFLEGLAALTWIAAWLFIVMPIFSQALSWLKVGIIPKRDLFWVTAGVKCEATGYKAKGFEGMDLCRPDYIHFSDWAGVDSIINYIFDVHIAVIMVICIAFFWWVGIVLFDKIDTTLSNRGKK